MDDPSSAHPSNHLLRAFGLGQLEAAEAEKVAEHLDGCRDCSETMAGLRDDTFVSLVRKSPAALAGQQAEVQATIDSHSGVLGESAALAELPPELLRHPRYEIVKLIGRGGMGDVYKAQHKLMNRTVALKVIRPELVRNAAAVDRFQREVQAAARLHHGNIVTAHDAEQAGDVHFLVMEFVDGTDLSQVVQERGPLPVPEACDYIRQAATGLEHARQLGMVHRDIKPHNLMLTGGQASSLPSGARGKRNNYPTTKILDFGLANFASEVVADRPLDNAASDSRGTPRSHQQLTQLGTMMGTPDYIAPEQAADARTADIRADIYSLGCTLHFLLTGKPPFEADNVRMKLKAHAEQLPPPLTALRNDVPTELANVVAQMMAKNPAERFQTPAEVADALTPFAQPATVPPKRRVRTLIAAALLGMAALLARVIYVEFDKGQFIVETADDKVAVMVGEHGLKIRDAVADREYRLQPGSQRVRTGEYEIDVKELPAGLEVKTTKFTLKRGGVARVSVSFKAKHELGPDLPPGAMSETVTTGFNGGFEVTKSGLPVIWFFYTPRTVPVGDFDILMDTTDFKEGEQSLKFVVRKCESTGGRLSPGFFNEFHVENHNPPGPFETKPGETYKISFWAKNAGSEFVFKARGVSALKGDKGVVIRSKETFNEWRRFECTYTIPPKMWLRLELNVVQPGTFWIDDVQIVRVNDKAPVKPNDPNDDPKKAAATAVARQWLQLVDAGKFGECWEGCAAFAKSQITKEQVAEAYDGIRKPLGNFKDRTLLSANSFPQLPGTPPGESIVVQFETTFSIGGKQLEQITLYWDQDNQWRVAGYHVSPAPSEPDSAIEQKKQAALTASQEWLKLTDAGKYGEAWDTSAKLCKDGIKRDAMDLAYQGLFQPLGPIKSRELRTNEYKTQLPRAPVGEYAVIQFSTQFTNGGVTETVVLTREPDGQWRVSGYFHAPETITPNSTSGSAVGGDKTPMR